MKKYFVILWVCVLGTHLYAQQDPLYSHYYWNEQLYNPAYVGSKDILHMQGIYRLQWAGFEGAPKTLNVAVHSPLKNDKYALGANLYNDKIGLYNRTGFDVAYAYRIALTERIKLSLGIQGSILIQKFRNDEAITDDGLSDPTVQNVTGTAFAPNFGTGLYMYSDRFAVGFGIPHIINGGIAKSNREKINQRNHYYVTGSYIQPIGQILKLMPTSTLRFNGGTPMNFDFNLNFIFADAFILGGGVRTDKSALILLQYQLIKNSTSKANHLRIGYSYDLSWSPLRSYNKGSHEMMLSYGFGKIDNGERALSPRYF